MTCYRKWSSLLKLRENGGLKAEPPDKFLRVTPFRLLEQLGNGFSASSSITNLWKENYKQKIQYTLESSLQLFISMKATTRIWKKTQRLGITSQQYRVQPEQCTHQVKKLQV